MGLFSKDKAENLHPVDAPVQPGHSVPVMGEAPMESAPHAASSGVATNLKDEAERLKAQEEAHKHNIKVAKEAAKENEKLQKEEIKQRKEELKEIKKHEKEIKKMK